MVATPQQSLGFLFLYSVAVVTLAFLTGLSLTLLLVVLLLLPVVVLLNRTPLRLTSLALGVLGGAMLLLLLDVFAHQTGAWYTVTYSAWRTLGSVSVETILFGLLYTTYLLVIYEYWFDDNKNTHPHTAFSSGGQFVLLLLLTFIAYVVLAFSALITHPLTGILALAIVAVGVFVLLSSPRHPGRLLQKASRFALTVAPLSFLIELVLVYYDIRLYALSSGYLATVPVFGQSVPVEELLLVLCVPALLALVYELCIDDGR